MCEYYAEIKYTTWPNTENETTYVPIPMTYETSRISWRNLEIGSIDEISEPSNNSQPPSGSLKTFCSQGTALYRSDMRLRLRPTDC